MGWVAMSLGWAVWGVERSHGLCKSPPFLFFPDQEKLEMVTVSEDARESGFEEVKSKWLKGGSLT